jgi:hypothetical protein
VKLAAAASPKRDRKAPYSYVVKARLVLPRGVSAAEACNGRVRVTLLRGSRPLAKAHARVKSNCRYRLKVRVPVRALKTPSGRLKLTTRFLGNAVLHPTKRTMSVKFGRP